MAYRFGSWKPYVPVARHRAESEREIARQARSGTGMQPVRIEGRTIARSFWGQGWCQHLESFSDYGNRLPRGRTYVRRGAVCDLKIAPGRIEARVIGSAMYRIELDIAPFPAADWAAPKRRCPAKSAPCWRCCRAGCRSRSCAPSPIATKACFPAPEKSRCAAAVRTGPGCASTLPPCSTALATGSTSSPSCCSGCGASTPPS